MNPMNSINQVPPSVRKSVNKVVTGWMWLVGALLVAAFEIAKSNRGWLAERIPFGGYTMYAVIGLFLIFVIYVTGKVNKSLASEGKNLVTEENKFGDARLFDQATKNGSLHLFDGNKLLIWSFFLPMGCLFQIVGLWFLYAATMMGRSDLAIPSIISLFVGFLAVFMLIQQDKRILNESKARNMFVDMAQRRWNISRTAYMLIVLISFLRVLFMIANGSRFLL